MSGCCCDSDRPPSPAEDRNPEAGSCCGGGPEPAATTGRARLAAVILAAGYSSRMGEFKPLLPLDARTAAESAVRLFHDAGIRDVGVVVGHRAEELEPLIRSLGAACIPNARYAEGMYSSVVAGIAALPPDVDGCFLLPVDIPLVRPFTVRRLAEDFRPGVPVLYPTFRGRHGHPPLIARCLFDEILAGDDDGGLKRILAAHATAAEETEVFDEGIRLDMDTPEDYARLRDRASRADCPNAAECAAILERSGTDPRIIRHGRAVAAVALKLADALGRQGIALDRDMILAAGLLHDLAKGSRDHAATAASIVGTLGFPAVARIIAAHSDLPPEAAPPDEAALVFLADKLVQEDRPVGFEARFRNAFARFADDPEALRAATRRLQTTRRIADAVEARTGTPLASLISDPVLALPEEPAERHEPPRVDGFGTTESVCPVCLRRIAAERVREDGDVYLVKTCPEHGTFKTIVWRGAPAYAAWGATAAKPARPTVCTTSTDRGCPFDCGLCPEHRQQSCCVLLEVTQRCNLACPVCFAASGRAAADPDLAEIETWLRMLKTAGRTVNIQLSGGEPTVRDDLPEIVALIRSLGFGFVQVNTNGIRIAQEPDYLQRLRTAGLDCVFLQFDGVTDAVHRRIRDRDLLAVKERAIANCAALDLGVVLVPVLVPGVNTMQIGDIIRFAVDRMPTVRTVHFQPISYFGRFPHAPADRDRITIPEVLQQIERQTGGGIRARDFRPGTAENPYCSFNGEFIVRPDGEILASRAPASSCCRGGDAAEDDAAEQARRFVARRWAAAAPEPSAECCDAGVRTDSLDAFLDARKRTLCISGMAFQDCGTLDLDRLRQCYIHVVSPDRRLVPLCAYNLSSIDGATLYRRPGS